MDEKFGLLVVGAGAVAGSWEPVCRAIEEVIDSPVKIDAKLANYIFSQKIFFLRACLNEQTLKGKREKATTALEEAKAEHRRLQQKISSNLKSLRNQYSLDEGVLNRILCKYLDLPFHVVTTNWDVSLEEYFSEHKSCHSLLSEVIHLHGAIEKPETLYFPSEMVFECWHEPRGLDGIHGDVAELIEKAGTLVIYGLSLSESDAELSTLMFGLNNNPACRVKIIDPNPDPIVARLKVFSRVDNIEVILPRCI